MIRLPSLFLPPKRVDYVSRDIRDAVKFLGFQEAVGKNVLETVR